MMAKTVCDAGHGTYFGEFFRCQRPADHAGRHQELTSDQMCSWRDEGGSELTLKPGERMIVCSRCGVLDQLDAWLPGCGTDRMETDRVCFYCCLFLNRKDAYDAGNIFVTQDFRWVSHSDQVSGAFSGKPTRLVCDDGQVFGPDTNSWDGGHIDPADRDEVAPNARLEWVASR